MNEINPETLIKLIDRLNLYPVGLPDAPEIREFFALYLTEDEITLAAAFPFKEVTAQELATRVRWSKEKTKEILESLAEKGTVVDYLIKEDRYWLLTPSVIGFVEFALMKLRTGVPFQRIAEVLHRYEEDHLWKEVFGSKTQIARAAVGYDIPVTSKVVPLNEVERIIRQMGGGSVQDCYCRQKSRLLDHPCTVASHQETCFALGADSSHFLVRRGYARAISADEMVARVRELGKLGLIHVTDNVREKPTFLCNCCGCCCGLLRGSNQKGVHHSVAPTPYLVAIDPNRCNGCTLCTKKCQALALKMGDDKRVTADLDKCLGCGQCLRFCRQGALSLRPRKSPPKTPRNETTKFLRIAWEKEKLWRMMWEIIKAKI